MYQKSPKFDFNDIAIVPFLLTDISSRSEINDKNNDGSLPIFVSPMDTVVSEENYKTFLDLGFEVCTPRGLMVQDKRVFTSISLGEFEDLILWYDELTYVEEMRILVDIANAHMGRLYDNCRRFLAIRKSPKHLLMIGNVANPSTYELYAKLGVDYIRVGIGGGQACLTSANTGVHYPMASLISECHEIKKKNGYNTKIIADGGFKNYDEIIKALALGADYVMLGSVLNKCLESCSDTYLLKKIKLNKKMSDYIWDNFPSSRKYFYKKFRGMSTKEVQKKWGKKKLTTSEGISKFNKVEYRLDKWVENFRDYLKSAMSYTDSKDLDTFKNSQYVFITENALKRYHK
jgi:IMP dehydrogenase/GMP reductase